MVSKMKFTFEYKAEILFTHELFGTNVDLTNRFDKLLIDNIESIKSSCAWDVFYYAEKYILSLYGIQLGALTNNGYDVDYEFKDGYIHCFGDIWYDVLSGEELRRNDNLSKDFGEYLTEELLELEDLGLDLGILYEKLEYDGCLYVELLGDTVQCKVEIEED